MSDYIKREDAIFVALQQPLYSVVSQIKQLDGIDIVRCNECRKSHIDGKTTHYLWCTEWGRSTDTFGYCERADRKE